MEIVLISNYLNHYQANFAKSIMNRGINFWFVSTEKIPKDRVKLGFSKEFESVDYVIYANDDIEHVKILIETCDILISTYYANDLIKNRVLDERKITFLYSERIFKPYDRGALCIIRDIYRWIKYSYIFSKYKFKSRCLFLLIGDYAVSDHIKCGIPKERIFKFAYFPSVSRYKERSYLENGIIKMCWVGRFLKWKHPEDAIFVLKELQDKGYQVSLTMIGNGPMEEDLRRDAEGYNVQFVGGKPFDEVRKYLHESDIYLFTSDYAEGWGCVLNEAMAEANAVIASTHAGATTFLITDGDNGITYDCSNQDLYNELVKLIDEPDRIKRLGNKARKTIEMVWNSDVAVGHLLELYESLVSRKAVPCFTGPCEHII